MPQQMPYVKVPYLPFLGRHRPYLEILLTNTAARTVSNKTFGLVDSGADQTVIPYSLGTQLKLDPPTAQEIIDNAGGVGGTISYIKRRCKVYLIDSVHKKLYGFTETICWTYPDRETQKQLDELVNKYSEANKFLNQSLTGSDLAKHFEDQKASIAQDYTSVLNRFETDVLLGRPFFDNFEFIQFCHKDRDREEKCFFNYRINSKKIVNQVDL